MSKVTPKNLVFLEVEEILWLHRTIDAAAKKKAKEINNPKKLLKHSGYNIALSILKKTGPLKEAAVISFTEKQSKLISGLIPPIIAHMESKIIPEYGKRIEKFPDKAEFFQKYLDGSKSLVVKLKSLKERIDA